MSTDAGTYSYDGNVWDTTMQDGFGGGVTEGDDGSLWSSPGTGDQFLGYTWQSLLLTGSIETSSMASGFVYVQGSTAGQVPVHNMPRYGNFCGAGGTGTPINGTDAACATHDACFGNLGINAGNYQGQLTPAQIQGASICNQQLCNTVLNINRSPTIPFTQRLAGAVIVAVFDLIGPQAAQCHQ